MDQPQPPAAPDAKKPSLGDRKLQAAVDQIESRLSKEYVDPYLAIVTDGLKLIYSKETRPDVLSLLDSLKSPQDVPRLVADAIANITMLIYRGSQGKMPADAAMPAMHVLSLYVLDAIRIRHKIRISGQMMAASVKLVNQTLFRMFGITNDKIAEAMTAAKSGLSAKRGPVEPNTNQVGSA